MDPQTHDFSQIVDFAFWQSYLDANGEALMTIDELHTLSAEMQPLILDALAYYLKHHKAPLLQEDE